MANYELIVIGTSWGGLHAVSDLLDRLDEQVDPAIVVAQHRGIDSPDGGLAELLQLHTSRPVRDATDKCPIERGHIYLAPPDYHLLIEPKSFALSTEDRVQHARPSIDVLFQTAADVYGERVIGVILTGANEDGAAGLAMVKRRGGVAIIQDPTSSERRAMPDAAIAATAADAVLSLDEIPNFLYGLCVEPAVAP